MFQIMSTKLHDLELAAELLFAKNLPENSEIKIILSKNKTAVNGC